MIFFSLSFITLIYEVVGLACGLLTILSASSSANLAGDSSGILIRWPNYLSLLSLIFALHFSWFVLLYISSFVILWGHFMFNIFRSQLLWKVFICCSIFLVRVHNSLLYENMLVTYALNILIHIFRVILLLVNVCLWCMNGALARCFLLLCLLHYPIKILDIYTFFQLSGPSLFTV